MADPVLVSEDIRRGRTIVDRLRDGGVPLEGAFWVYDDELERWKLVAASPEARTGTRDLYFKAVHLLSHDDMTQLRFVRPEDPTFRAVSEAHGAQTQDGKRVRYQLAHGVYVRDALVYRLAA